MQDIDLGSLVYLGALLLALLGWFVLQARLNIGRVLQQMTVWALIFIAVIAVYGLWGDIQRTVVPRQSFMAEAGRVELPRAPDGHYYATLQVNGVPVEFVVDTGATAIVLSQRDAERAGLTGDGLAYLSQAQTANGMVRTALVTLDEVALGPFADSRVSAYVNEGQMDHSLLGMTYLQRYDRLEIADGKMILER